MLRFLYAVLFMTATLIASPIPSGGEPTKAPIMVSWVVGDAQVINLHVDGEMTLCGLSEGRLEAKILSFTTTDPQVLSTSWVSNGNTHTVTTPLPNITNPTPQQIAAVIQRHQLLVSAMQAAYPPDPPQ